MGIARLTSMSVAVFAAITLSFSASAANVKLKLANANTKTHIATKADFFFAKRVNELTGGEVEIQIVFGGTLGGEKETIQLLRTGALDMTTIAIWNAVEFVRPFEVAGAAFVIKGWSHFVELAGDPKFQGLLNKAVEDAKPGFKMVYFSSSGTRQLYTKKEIHSLADLKGLKMRSTGSALTSSVWSALGTNPTPVDWTELYPALQTGVVEGAENALSGILSKKLYEICPYILQTSHNFSVMGTFLSDSAGNRLSKKQRAALETAASEARVYMYKLAMEEEQGQIDKLNAQPGVKVFTKGPKDRAAWVELVKPVNVKLAGESGAKEILDYMVKTGAAH